MVYTFLTSTFMNLLRFFTQDEQIAGLAITEEALRLVFLQHDRNTQEALITTKEEELLPAGVIVDGIIKDKDALTSSLKALLAKTKPNLKYFTVSIPGDRAYYKVFSFPKNITNEKIREAMDLATSFQLPFPKENVYFDWEKGANNGEGEEFSIILCALKKEIADDYIACLKKAGIKVIALEIHPLSILRLAEPSPDTTLVTEKGGSGTLIFIVKNGIIRFMRMIPRTFINNDDVQKEITKVCTFYETEHGPVSAIINSAELPWRTEILTYSTQIEDRAQWSAALGAAVRAAIGRSKDNFMSLMPIGTEKAYEYQRAAAFSNLITNVSVGLSFFFAISFIASYGLMLTIQGNFSRQISGLGAVAMPTDAAIVEERVQNINTLVTKTSAITRSIPRFSNIVEEITAKASQDITINNLTIPSPEGRIGISGVAKDRASLNAFRNTLREWNTITTLDFPTTNLEQNENIPFQAAFSLSDPQSLYNWK